ncbi:hypothetical protein M885DRAFT_500392 [Pelagophyceae sp. CCMP2097]|nr:hypothetical protein M885DRAFT_500392 [Pelagophyceae sp. CCMP2097]
MSKLLVALLATVAAAGPFAADSFRDSLPDVFGRLGDAFEAVRDAFPFKFVAFAAFFAGAFVAVRRIHAKGCGATLRTKLADLLTFKVPTSPYHFIFHLDSLRDLLPPPGASFQPGFWVEYPNHPKEFVESWLANPKVTCAVLGKYNVGKTYLASVLTGLPLPQGDVGKGNTTGLRGVMQADEEVVLLDTQGRGRCAKLGGLMDSEKVDELIERVCVDVADVLVFVVGPLDVHEQKAIHRICARHGHGKRLVVVHNYKDFGSKKDVDEHVQRDVLDAWGAVAMSSVGRPYYWSKVAPLGPTATCSYDALKHGTPKHAAACEDALYLEHLVLAKKGTSQGHALNAKTKDYLRDILHGAVPQAVSPEGSILASVLRHGAVVLQETFAARPVARVAHALESTALTASPAIIENPAYFPSNEGVHEWKEIDLPAHRLYNSFLSRGAPQLLLQGEAKAPLLEASKSPEATTLVKKPLHAQHKAAAEKQRLHKERLRAAADDAYPEGAKVKLPFELQFEKNPLDDEWLVYIPEGSSVAPGFLVFEDATSFSVIVELPGIKSLDHVNLTVDHRCLIIRGYKPTPQCCGADKALGDCAVSHETGFVGKIEGLIHKGTTYGAFALPPIALPDGVGSCKAALESMDSRCVKLHDGELEIKIPKEEI